MSKERERILQMVSEGKVTAEEGASLLNALHSPRLTPKTTTQRNPRWFRVRVLDGETERVKIKVNLPLGLVNAAVQMGARFSPAMQDVDWDELMAAIDAGVSGKLVEIIDNEGGERIEMFVN